MQNIIEIIKSLESIVPNVNPTQIYNEGWMTRLLMIQSVTDEVKFGGINFKNLNWTSEGLISSPFIKTNTREGYTHPDIILGDIKFDYAVSGNVEPVEIAKIFGIIEAKMGSGLSKGTTNCKNDYNQASRNIACISHKTYKNKDCKTFFIIVAPEVKLTKIEEQIRPEIILNQIKDRFEIDKNVDTNLMLRHAKNCIVEAWSYEDWIEAIINIDCKKALQNFYLETKKWNKIKERKKLLKLHLVNL